MPAQGCAQCLWAESSYQDFLSPSGGVWPYPPHQNIVQGRGIQSYRGRHLIISQILLRTLKRADDFELQSWDIRYVIFSAYIPYREMPLIVKHNCRIVGSQEYNHEEDSLVDAHRQTA